MNQKFLRALRELQAGREVWLVVHHPVRHEVRRICLRALTDADDLPKGTLVLVKRGTHAGALPPWVAEVRGFSFAPDLLGNERIVVSGPSDDHGHSRWVGRCEIAGIVISDHPHDAQSA